MNTWLQLVSSEAIAQLRAVPTSINALNQPADIERVLRALKAVDPKSVAERVKLADPEELEEAEVFDFDILTEGDEDPGELLNREIAGLTKFYEQALKSGLGVAMYTQ